MTEAEMNSYRFGSGEEPTDEMLAQIMHEAAADASKRAEEAHSKYLTYGSKWRLTRLKNHKTPRYGSKWRLIAWLIVWQ